MPKGHVAGIECWLTHQLEIHLVLVSHLLGLFIVFMYEERQRSEVDLGKKQRYISY